MKFLLNHKNLTQAGLGRQQRRPCRDLSPPRSLTASEVTIPVQAARESLRRPPKCQLCHRTYTFVHLSLRLPVAFLFFILSWLSEFCFFILIVLAMISMIIYKICSEEKWLQEVLLIMEIVLPENIHLDSVRDLFWVRANLFRDKKMLPQCSQHLEGWRQFQKLVTFL